MVILQKVDEKMASMRNARTPGYRGQAKADPQSGTRLSLGRRASAAHAIKEREQRVSGHAGAENVQEQETTPPRAVAGCWRRGEAVGEKIQESSRR